MSSLSWLRLASPLARTEPITHGAGTSLRYVVPEESRAEACHTRIMSNIYPSHDTETQCQRQEKAAQWQRSPAQRGGSERSRGSGSAA